MPRIILAYAGIPFEDIRYTHQEWAEVKMAGNFPNNQIPCLEFDGKKHGQSMAIARFLAREHGLAGKNSYDEFKADAVVDCMYDLLIFIWLHQFYPQNQEAKEAMWIKISTEVADRIFTELTTQLGDGPYFLGDYISWADLSFVQACDVFDARGVTVLMQQYPRLMELRKRLLEDEKIANYIKNRPVTET